MTSAQRTGRSTARSDENAAPWPLIDDADFSIVSALQRDGRSSFASLAKECRLPLTRIRQRHDQLTATGTLQTVALIDPGALGRPTVAHLDVITRNGSHRVAERLVAVPGVAWIGVDSDYEHLLVQVSTRDNASLVALMNEHLRNDPAVAHATAAIVLRSWSPIFDYTGRGSAANLQTDQLLWRTGSDSGLTIDEIDRALLACLEQDARMTITAMSAVTGLSVPATRQRLRRLLELRIVRLRSRPDPRSPGVSVVRVLLDVVDDTTRMVSELTRIPNVSFVSESTAANALSIEMMCASEQQIADVFGRITRVPGASGGRLIRFAEILTRGGHW